MNWEAIAALAELVGAIGVIVTLLYVGLQVRQNTVAVRAAARNELAAGSRDWLLAVAGSPELSDAVGLWVIPDAELTLSQEHVALIAVRALLRNLENVSFQVRAGIVPEGALRSYGIQSVPLRGPRFRDFWMGERDSYDTEFVALLETSLGLR